MSFKPFRFWCYKVLPLVYDDSLSYYELLCKVIKALNDIGITTEEHNTTISEILSKLNALTGFTDDQLRTILDEMVENGDFDFLVDLLTSKTELWDVVGLTPFAQGLIEGFDNTFDTSDYSCQGMAVGEISGTKVMFIAWTNSDKTANFFCTYNLTTGSAIGYNKTATLYAGNSVGFNPTDEYFYVVSGGTYNKIGVFNMYCNLVKTIDTTWSGYKAGGITFNRSTSKAYIAWYSTTGTNADVTLCEYSDISSATTLTINDADNSNVWNRGYTTSVGRQDIYNDGIYIYMITWWHEIRPYFNKQDVFSLSTLEYVRTQHIDACIEAQAGDYLNDIYYMTLNNSNACYIYQAAVRADKENNNTYRKIANIHPVSFVSSSSDTIDIYVNAETVNFFADGSASYPFRRIFQALYNAPINFANYINFYISGDTTENGQFPTLPITKTEGHILFSGVNGVNNDILPRIIGHEIDSIKFHNLQIKSYASNYCVEFRNCHNVYMNNVKFVDGKESASMASVIVLRNSYLHVDGGRIGYDGNTPTLYLSKYDNSEVNALFYYDYDTTGSGNYTTLGEFTFEGNDALTGVTFNSNVHGIMTNAGLIIEGEFSSDTAISANNIVLVLPDDKLQYLESNIANEFTYGYLLGYDSSGSTYRLRYNVSGNTIETLENISADTNIYFNGIIGKKNITI